MNVLLFGASNFFVPRMLPAMPWLIGRPENASYYDTRPLKATLERLVDFDRINAGPMRFSVGAVNVRTGNFAYFDTTTHRIRVEHIIASGSLPPGFPATEIDGEYYWDGGFMGNPAIFPVIYGCTSCDILLVHLTPTVRTELPTTAHTILDRMEEISFNAALMREMRVVAFMTEMIDEGKLSGGKRIFIHAIEAEDVIRNLSGSSKMNADWNFLMHLFELGRERADKWLSANFDRVGVETTVDLKSAYF